MTTIRAFASPEARVVAPLGPGATVAAAVTPAVATVDVICIPGPPGPSGQGFVFVQSTPSVTWVIDHPLGFAPNVTVVDSAGTQVEGDVNYATVGQLVLTFSSAFSGKAYLS